VPDRVARLPRWAHALLIFVACQLLTAVLIDRAARFTVLDAQGHTSRWSYLRFVARWDSAWYRRIAQEGYPLVLPLDGTGEVKQNGWAFYPLFPMLARALMALPGVGWPLAGWLVAVISALAAAILLRLLVERLGGPALALWSVALLGSFTTAPVLQFPYSDSLALALVLAVLCCLQRRRYALVVPLLLVIGLARPVAVPLAVVVAVHAVRRLRRRPLTALSLVGAAGVGAVAWPVIAAVVTGRRSAYTDTMGAWRYGRGVVPVDPWLDASARYLGPVFGRVLLIVVPLGVLWWLTRPAARFLGADLRVWCVAYGVYLLAVLDPTTSLARYLLLLFPLGVLLAAASPHLAYRRALVAFGFVTQLVWIVTIWRLGGFPP
jgi:MFS family permease